MNLSAHEVRAAVRAALAEDTGSGDATTLATVPLGSTARAVMRAREPMVVAGIEFAATAFRKLSGPIQLFAFVSSRKRRRQCDNSTKLMGF